MSLRSPLGKVLGLGAAKDGVGHWWVQRIGSVAVAVLSAWFLVSLLMLGSLDYDSVRAWVAAPWNTVLLLLLVLSVMQHSQLGIQVVVEDYVSSKGTKILTMLIVNALHILLAAAGVVAVLRISFGTAGVAS
jgi:succinate dehydrogenase / fumarate reductase membrane anchor subunit